MKRLGRRGAVVAVSGGIDSAVAAGICVRALGPDNVLCLRLPERDIGTSSSDLGLAVARALGAQTEEEPITDALEALGCYRRATRRSARSSPTTSRAGTQAGPLGSDREGSSCSRSWSNGPTALEASIECRSTPYRELLAATNMKQRVRKLLEYTWADRLDYAVVGTPNLLEYDQGFFVKGGDGLADVKPIARLYKTQVFALGARARAPEQDR